MAEKIHNTDALFESQSSFIFKSANEIFNLFGKLIRENKEENFGVCATAVTTALSLALSRFIEDGIDVKEDQHAMVDIVAENTKNLLNRKKEGVVDKLGSSWFDE